MALTGYTFKDTDDIRPLVEESGKGKTFDFIKKLAQQMNAYVICGYPEVDG